MREQVIKTIVSNLEHASNHFLKRALVYTNSLAGTRKAGER